MDTAHDVGDLSLADYDRALALVPIVCVDVLVWRADRYLLIVRADEYAAPCFALVGGRVRIDETIRAAIDRHVRTTTKLEPNHASYCPAHPTVVEQYLRTRTEGFGFDPRKHAIALTYVVESRGRARPSGEASELVWLPLHKDISIEEFAYQQGSAAQRALEALRDAVRERKSETS